MEVRHRSSRSVQNMQKCAEILVFGYAVVWEGADLSAQKGTEASRKTLLFGGVEVDVDVRLAVGC